MTTTSFQDRYDAARAAMWERHSAAKTDEGRTEAHRQWCRDLMEIVGDQRVRATVPFSTDRVQAALRAGDRHLNTLPLRAWDSAARGLGAGVRWGSLSDGVCILKEAARLMAEDHTEDDA